MSRRKPNLSVADILGRVSALIGSEDNVDIARSLGVNAQVCTNWRSRGTIPWAELLAFSGERKLSFRWLLTGEKSHDVDLTPQEVALIRTLRFCGPEYAKRVYVAATVRAARLLEEGGGEEPNREQKRKDLETLSIAAIE